MIPHLSQDLIDRFWSRVDVRGEDECWNWTACSARYGIIRYKGKNLYSHRLAYYLDTGEQPDGCVCHKCDNKLCCNPRHLFLGSHQDNQADKVQKGRQAKGENNGKSKYTKEEVLIAKEMLNKGAKLKEVQNRCNMPISTIWGIKIGHTWGWLEE